MVGLLPSASLISSRTFSSLFWNQKDNRFFLSKLYKLQSRSMCFVSSIAPSHVSDRQRPSGFSLFQCLPRYADLYLPDRNLACCIAFATSCGLFLAVYQIGCGTAKLMKFKLQYINDGSTSGHVISSPSSQLFVI